MKKAKEIYSKKMIESKSKDRNAFSVLLIGRVGIDCDFRQSIYLPVENSARSFEFGFVN